MSEYFWYTDSIDEAAEVLAGKTQHLAVRFGLYKRSPDDKLSSWRHEFHLETIRKDLHKDDVPWVQARQYILDKMFEAEIKEIPVPNSVTKKKLVDYSNRNFPWLGHSTQTTRPILIEEVLKEIPK